MRFGAHSFFRRKGKRSQRFEDTVLVDGYAHCPKLEHKADILATCTYCGTRMFKTAKGQWKATSAFADNCTTIDRPE